MKRRSVLGVLLGLSLLPATAAGEGRLPGAGEGAHVRLGVGKDWALTLGGYVETFYSWNTRRPQLGINEFRAFDNRHNSLSLQALALDVSVRSRHFELRVVPQAGLGPATYYGASEPSLLGSALTPASDASAWQHLQQAWVAYHPWPERLTLDAGLFLSPIGVEGMPSHANHHWSHSVMFFALPFYHLGARVRWQPSPTQSLRAGLYNGWNSVGDGNAEKTLGLDYALSLSSSLSLGAAYFVGVERPQGAPEGRAVRQLFDVHAQWAPHSRVDVYLWGNAGFEPNALGTSAWVGATASARLRLFPWLYAASRFTALHERRASDGRSAAAAMLMPADRIYSRSLTLEVRPFTGLSLKLEGRADDADRSIYYAGAARVPNTREQTTLTLGATGWF